jgi:hypothetical protein
MRYIVLEDLNMAARKNGEKKETIPTSVRITPVCKELWDTLAERAGVSNTAYLETLIREKAKAEGVKNTSYEN